METYRTVADRGEAAFEVRGSRFIGYAAPVAAVGAAEAFVETVRRGHPDATHNVPAYRVRAAPIHEYESDDGEPGGSAGKPALTLLQREHLENVAVVVTRYYGGTNLGVGGLSRAYTRATKDAVEDAGIVERRPHERAVIAVEYGDSGTVRGILESADVEFEADYAEQATFHVRVPTAEAERLFDRLRSATSGRADIDSTDPDDRTDLS